jgi:GPI-anchor transamidase subunit K
MIDTCQANTMYSKIYSPNIIATGSSEIDESSYSHHADNDVGVAVIDRYTYYNLDFLESQVREPSSKLTLGDLFDSYDEAKIHSRPGVRYDLFHGGEQEARKRLVMDFFGNVQNVEVEGNANETAWREDLAQIEQMVKRARARFNDTSEPDESPVRSRDHQTSKRAGAMRIDSETGWFKQIGGALALLGCVGAWAATSWIEYKR